MRGEHSFAVPTKFFCIALRHARYFSGEKHSVYHRFGDILLRVCWIPEKLPINDILWSLLSAVVIAFVRDSVLGISYGHYFRIPCVVFLEQYGNAHAVLGFVYDASWRTVIVLVKYPHAHWRHIGTDGHISIFPHHEG